MVCAVRLRTHNQWSRIDCPSPHFLACGIFDRGRTPHTHTRTHTHTHTHTPHPQTQLIRTQLTHTYSSTHNLLHTNPSPSLFSFLLTPCRLCLSFVACWKKLTCGVIRSFNLLVEELPATCWNSHCSHPLRLRLHMESLANQPSMARRSSQ